MNIEKLFEKRWVGIVRIGFFRTIESNRLDTFTRIESLKKVLSRFGLSCEDESCLTEIDSSTASDILYALLLKGMAYKSQMMEPLEANSMADDFFSLFPEDGTRYYTNGRWDNYLIGNISGHVYHPMTEATFDGGVIAISEEISGFIWFQDEG